MNFKTTLVLVVLLVIVGAYVFFVARDATPTYEIEEAQRAAGREAQGERLFDEGLQADNVTRVTITRGEEKAAFEKVAGKWQQVEPARFPADEFKIEGLVGDAVDLRAVDEVKIGSGGQPNLKDLSLEPARATVTLTAGDEQHVIAIGRRSTGGRGYIALGDSRVYVVNDALHAQLATPEGPTTWRRKSLQAPTANQLDGLMLNTSEAEVTLTKRDGRWYFGDSTERASEEAVAEVVRNVGYLSAQSFVENVSDLATYGLEPARQTITLRKPATDEDDQPVVSTLRLGGAADVKEESLYATWTEGGPDAAPSTVVFTLSKSSVDRLAKKPDDLRDKRLTTTKNAADVTGVEVTRAGAPVVRLQRDGGRWKFAEGGPSFGVETTAANDLVDAVLNAEAERFEPAPEDAEAAATIEIRAAGREQPETVKLYPAAGDSSETHWLAVRGDEPVAYVVPRERLSRALVEPAALRDKLVLDLPPDSPSAVTIEHPHASTFAFSRADGRWSLQGAERFEAGDFDRLLHQLRSLRAESWVTDGRMPGEATVDVTLQLSEGSRRLRVDPETRIATVDGIDTPFILPVSVVDLLTTEYRDRAVISLSADELEQVTLSRSDQTVTIRRGEDDLYEVEGAEVDQAQAAAVFDTLDGLRVKRWVDGAAAESSGGIRLEITPRSGEPQVLVVNPGSDAGTIGTGDAARSFLLDDADVAKLVAPIAPEEAEKAQAAEAEAVK